MDIEQIHSLRDGIGMRRVDALTTLRSENVSKAALRRFVEHYCDRFEVDQCDYSYESLMADALVQLDMVYETAIRALDLAAGVLELGVSLTDRSSLDLRRLNRPLLRLRCSALDEIVSQLDTEFYFWLAVADEEFCEFIEA